MSIFMKDNNFDPKKLSDKDQKLLEELIKGRQNKQIAYDHEIPLHIVKYRLRTLYDKMGVQNRTQAALMAREMIL